MRLLLVPPVARAGVDMITYLLYKEMQPQGTFKGVFITFASIWWTLVLTVMVVRLFTTEPSDPVFKGEL